MNLEAIPAGWGVNPKFRRRRVRRSEILRLLEAEPALLTVSRPVLVADLQARFRVSPGTVRRALAVLA